MKKIFRKRVHTFYKGRLISFTKFEIKYFFLFLEKYQKACQKSIFGKKLGQRSSNIFDDYLFDREFGLRCELQLEQTEVVGELNLQSLCKRHFRSLNNARGEKLRHFDETFHNN